MRLRRSTALNVLLLVCLSFLWLSGVGAAQGKTTFMVPMSDGMRLATDVYLPEGAGPFPVILLRTPYNKDSVEAAANGPSLGYAVVVQDTRGRYASEGKNLPFEGDYWGDRADGYDTLEWIARQSWCDGKIGTVGASAGGFTQFGMAGTGSPRITCQHIMVAAPRPYHDAIFPGGVFKKALAEGWLAANRYEPDALRIWASHPAYDDYWRARDLSLRYDKVDAPVVHVGGWYDMFSQGTIDAFIGCQTKGGPRARGAQKLVMGPWEHGVLQDTAGELTFPNGAAPPNNVHDMYRWFEYYLKGADNGIEREAAVTYYVMGDVSNPSAPGNVWRTAEKWPPVEAKMTPYYFHDNRTLSAAKPKGGRSITYTYDPKDPVPTIGGAQLTLPAGPRDQRKIEERQDVLVFTSEPLAEPLTVTGRVRIHLWASSDAPDTDFIGRLCDVYPDGRSINVCEGALRARFRESFEREKLMEPGKPYHFVIDLWTTSIIFNRGHRLRVHITSSSAPGYDPNPNTGEPFRSSDRTRTAHNTVYLDAKRPSHILLPVVEKRTGAQYDR